MPNQFVKKYRKIKELLYRLFLCLDVVFLGYFPAIDNSYFHLGIIDENQL
jgi:hypothetical protein